MSQSSDDLIVYVNLYKLSWPSEGPKDGQIITYFNAWGDPIYGPARWEWPSPKWELCEQIKRHLPNFVFMDAPIGEDPDKRDYIISNEKIEATGFQTTYSLDNGIVELIKGYEMIRNNSYGNV